MSITIKDIARIANVSHTTVSRALNDSPYINKKTRDRIVAIAREHDYVPNVSARSLVLQKSYNIALFFSTISQGTSSEFFHEAVDGINRVVKQNYNLTVRGIDDYEDFALIDKKRFDGIILMSQRDSDNVFIENVLQKNIPLVVLNRKTQNDLVLNILSGDRNGTYDAAEFLIKNGHKNIAFIEGKKGFKSSLDRKEGFICALNDYKLSIDENLIIPGDYNIESGYKGMKRLLNSSNIPTAVFCSNDDMAVGAMRAIAEHGLKVPEDISVIGFDNSVVCNYTTPALTTVKKPTKEMSIMGAEKLLGIIEGRETKIERIYVNTELIIRESVRNIN